MKRALIDLTLFVIMMIIMIVVWRYIQKNYSYSQTEAEEEAHLRRLFGDAWRQAKDL